MRELVEALSRNGDVEITLRSEPPSEALGACVWGTMRDGVFVPDPRRVYSAPDDLVAFRDLVKTVTIFSRSDDLPPAHNGWETLDTDHWLFRTPNDLLFGVTQECIDHFDRCFIVGENLSSGPDYVAVDLHEDRYGWIVLTWFEYSVEDAPYPVIAHSFAEWLERTIASGPDVRYWEREDFVDLGPAIPGDPNYHPPNQRVRRI